MTDPRDIPVVLCVGNPDRGDDGLATLVARGLRAADDLDAAVLELDVDGVDLARAWGEARCVVIVDATRSDAAPGTITRFDAAARPLPASLFATSTHVFGVAQGVELARVLGSLPEALVVYGVEGASYDHGQPVTGVVRAVIGDVVRRVLGEVQRMGDAAHA
jgi:hydrogenase maturation protease